MNYNQLRASEISVSEISFGCMSLEADAAANKKLLHQALDQGINFFDTADIYQQGANESTIGKAFKGMRNKIVLATKVGNVWRSDGSGLDWNPSRMHILAAVEKSLQRLQTDYIDLYQLHGGTIDDPIDETIAAFELLKEQGKIRAYGISSIRPNVIREYVKRSQLVSVMLQYSLLDRRPEEQVLDLLQAKGISVLARGAYAQGRLLGKVPAPYLAHSEAEVKALADAVKSVAAGTRTMPEVALRFVLHRAGVASAVTGIRTEAQLNEALTAAGSLPLSRSELQELTNVVPPKFYEQHR